MNAAEAALNAADWAPPRAEELRAALVAAGNLKPVLDSICLVKGVLGKRGLSVLYGDSNTGKTFMASDLAAHVATGHTWHGCKVRAGGCVVYVASEGGNSVGNRIVAIMGHRPELAIKIRNRLFLLPKSLNLHDGNDAKALIDTLQPLGMQVDLVVVDTLARSMGAGDENSPQDMGGFIRSIDLIREALATHVMVVHHTGKDSSRGARGHSSLRAAADTEIEVRREGEYVTAFFRKQRDMAMGPARSFKLVPVALGRDSDGDSVETCVLEPVDQTVNSVPQNHVHRIVFEELTNLLATDGVIRDGGPFRDSRSFPIKALRGHCFKLKLSDGTSASAKSKAFSRSLAKLLEYGHIASDGIFVGMPKT